MNSGLSLKSHSLLTTRWVRSSKQPNKIEHFAYMTFSVISITSDIMYLQIIDW